MLFKKHFYYKKHLTYLFVSLFFLVISASPVYASELFSNTTFTSNLSSWDIGEMPTDLAAVQAWFRSDQITGVSDGGSVNSWTDLSGNGYTATQSATSQQPVYKANMLNGQPTVHFNGSQYLQLLPASLGIANSTGGLSLFAVIKSASATQRVVSLSTPTGTDRAVMGRTNGSAFMADGKRLDSDSTQTLSGGTYTTNNFSVDDAIFNYSSRNLNIFSSGTSQATTTTFQTVGNTSATNSKSILIGSDNTNGLNGDIAEVIIVNSALSTADRANIETYLGNRYGLTVTSASISATRTNTFTYNGNAMSAKVVTTGTANFTQMVNVGDTNTYTLTAYVHNATGKAITANDVQLFAQGSSVSTIYTPQANGWYQLTGSVTGLSSLSDYGLQISANETLYIGSMSLQLAVSASDSSSSSSIDSGNDPNFPKGWAAEIMAGPNFVGDESFISNISQAQGISVYIGTNSISDDLNLTFSKSSSTAFYNVGGTILPPPQFDGFNVISDLYGIKAISAFNGYPETQTDSPYTILLYYDPLKYAAAHEQPEIVEYNPDTQSWESLSTPNIINTSNSTIANTTTDFSYFAVAVENRALAPVLGVTTKKNVSYASSQKNIQNKHDSVKPLGTVSAKSKNCLLFFLCF